jgi:hypothetical protein
MATNRSTGISANSLNPSLCPVLSPKVNFFPGSSFFRERRAPELPSPDEIRSLNQASDHYRATSFNRPSPVAIPSLGLLVKYGADVTVAEVETQVLIHERLQGEVPVPEVFGWAEDGGQIFIYMALVKGETLQARFGSMDTTEREAVCQQLRVMVNAWRSITQDENDRYIGKLTGETIQVSKANPSRKLRQTPTA